jgi:hypothetical protein
MKHVYRGVCDQPIGIRLPQKKLDDDPDLFYRALDWSRQHWHKVQLQQIPPEKGGGVWLRSQQAWQSQAPEPHPTS